MKGTRRFWQLGLLGVLLTGAAVVFQRPLLLGGAATLGAFLLAVQYDFITALQHIDSTVSIDQTVTPTQVTVSQTAQATLTISLTEQIPADITAAMRAPAGVRVTDTAETTVTLTSDETEATTTAALDVPVAGTHEFDQPTLTVTGSHGRFSETVEHGPTRTLFAQPHVPRGVHIGKGGDEIAAQFGEHASGQLGSGLEPAELREYQPGDAASQIDWKATARLNDPYVQEFEAQTDRTIGLIVDHRCSMATGGSDETETDKTKLAYAREVALSVLQQARAVTDTVGLYTVGDEGITTANDPAATPDHFESLRRELLDMEPTESRSISTPSGQSQSPQTLAKTATELAGDSSQFARTLAPFLETNETYVDHVANDPLFGAVQSWANQRQGRAWTILFTDDTYRKEVLECVKRARQNGNHVLVFLTPSVLFEPDTLSDLDTAYDQYQKFESFRQQLDRLTRVSAFEVGPGDRITSILTAQTKQRGKA